MRRLVVNCQEFMLNFGRRHSEGGLFSGRREQFTVRFISLIEESDPFFSHRSGSYEPDESGFFDGMLGEMQKGTLDIALQVSCCCCCCYCFLQFKTTFTSGFLISQSPHGRVVLHTSCWRMGGTSLKHIYLSPYLSTLLFCHYSIFRLFPNLSVRRTCTSLKRSSSNLQLSSFHSPCLSLPYSLLCQNFKKKRKKQAWP